MPTPSADWQASISGLLMGASTPYQFAPALIDGLGNPKAKAQDVALDFQDGSVGSPDYRDVRVLLVHLEILEDTPDAAFAALTTLKDAWLPVEDDIQFHVQLPGFGHRYFNGRPRELEADLSNLRSGRITCIGTFVALDPQSYVP